jgi:3-methyladenine DNA glycosylase Tag
MEQEIVTGPDGLSRCWWSTSTEAYALYHIAFANFDFHKIAHFNSRGVARLLGDAGHSHFSAGVISNGRAFSFR